MICPNVACFVLCDVKQAARYAARSRGLGVPWSGLLLCPEICLLHRLPLVLCMGRVGLFFPCSNCPAALPLSPSPALPRSTSHSITCLLPSRSSLLATSTQPTENPPHPLSIALQSSLIRRHQSASSLSLLDMDLRSQRSMPLKGRQGREAALKAALHTPHHSSMLALPPSSVSMEGMAPAGSANPVDAKQEGPGKAAATATAVATGAANSPRLMQVGAAWS